jgi:hypothetical protein
MPTAHQAGATEPYAFPAIARIVAEVSPAGLEARVPAHRSLAVLRKDLCGWQPTIPHRPKQFIHARRKDTAIARHGDTLRSLLPVAQADVIPGDDFLAELRAMANGKADAWPEVGQTA